MSDKNKKDLSSILFSQDFQDAVIRMRLMMEPQIEYLKLKAVLHKAKYDALIENGFTPEQALELCKDI
jgi:hypothetical protein